MPDKFYFVPLISGIRINYREKNYVYSSEKNPYLPVVFFIWINISWCIILKIIGS